MNGFPGGATAGGADATADADADAAADALADGRFRSMARPVSWNAVTIDRADGAGQQEAQRNQKPEKDPAAPDVMAAHRGALSSHLRLYNELG